MVLHPEQTRVGLPADGGRDVEHGVAWCCILGKAKQAGNQVVVALLSVGLARQAGGAHPGSQTLRATCFSKLGLPPRLGFQPT